MSQTKAQLVSPVGILTASGISVTGVVTASSFVGDVTGDVVGNLTGDATGLSGTPNIVAGVVTATSFVGNVTGDATGLSGTPNIVAGVVTATSFVGDVTGNVVGNLTGTASTATAAGTAYALEGSPNLNVGVVTATSFYGDGSNLDGVVSGIELKSAGSSVGTAITAIDFASGATLTTASAGISTITIAAGGSGEFNTGITSSVQVYPTSYESTVFTFPSTAGKQYVIESINVANVDTSVGIGTTVNIIASVDGGEQTYVAYNVPITNGGLIELLKNPIVAGPSDAIKMWVTNENYVGVADAAEVYMNYAEYDSTEYIKKYASTVSIAATDPTTIYTSTTYPTVLEAIHFANRTDAGDYPVSISITNGLTTTYLAKNLIIPRYSTIDILDRPKRVEVDGTVKVEVGQTSTIDIIIAGKQITS